MYAPHTIHNKPINKMKIIQDIKSALINKKRKRAWARAKEVYQVKEHHGELWITMYGSHCIPQSMIIGGDAIKCVEKLRSKYFLDLIDSI